VRVQALAPEGMGRQARRANETIGVVASAPKRGRTLSRAEVRKIVDFDFVGQYLKRLD